MDKRIVNRFLRPLGLEVRRVNPKLPIPPVDYPNLSRFLYFRRLFDRISDLDGDVVECGVGMGHSFLMLACLVRDEMRGRKLWGFDSFEGFPEPSEDDRSTRKARKGEWSDTSVLQVQDLLVRSGLDQHFVQTQVTLVKGFFEESLSKFRGPSIVLLHLDVDLYNSYLTCLEHLYPKVAQGGVILFDEYMNTMEHLKFPGAQRAIDEYLGEDKFSLQRDVTSGKYFAIKGMPVGSGAG